jgi:hypothetical protein
VNVETRSRASEDFVLAVKGRRIYFEDSVFLEIQLDVSTLFVFMLVVDIQKRRSGHTGPRQKVNPPDSRLQHELSLHR